MPLARDDALCLRVTPFSESSQVTSLLTRGHGRVRLLAKGATRRTKAGKSKFDGGLDLLDAGIAMFAHVPERDLGLLHEWKLTDGHPGLRGSLRSAWQGLYAAELVDALLEEHQPVPRLFDNLARLLKRLTEPRSREAAFLAFQLNLLRRSGILPDLSRCADGTTVREVVERDRPVAFLPGEAVLICGDRAMREGVPLPASALGAMASLLRLARSGGDLPELTRAQVDPASRVIAAHVQHEIGRRLRTARLTLGGG
jgi:DNA repair protein RecO (recombination protein O)